MKLRDIMNRKGWNAAKIADITGRNIQTVYGWLSGRPVPANTLRMLDLLSR